MVLFPGDECTLGICPRGRAECWVGVGGEYRREGNEDEDWSRREARGGVGELVVLGGVLIVSECLERRKRD